MGEEVDYTEGKRNIIYREFLVPLKLKISQILLYDTETAMGFLQEYNQMIKNEEELGLEILSKINELELKINEYEKYKGKEKMNDEQSNILIQQIDDLQVHYKQLSLEDFERQLKEISNLYYNNSKNYNLENRESIERRINSLEANFIIQKVSLGQIEDIKEIITQDNKQGLTMYIYSELSNIMQSKNATVQNIVNRLRTIIANGDEFVYDSETWKLLSLVQNNIITANNKQRENIINLPAVQNKKIRFSFLDRIFGNKIKIGDSEMKIKKTIQLGTQEIRTKDVSKINMNWLASNISKQMLEEIEIRRLKEEGIYAVEIYLPDEKTPIYDFMSKNYYYVKNSMKFFNEEGIEINMLMDSTYGEIELCLAQELKVRRDTFFIRKICQVTEYAKFIDSIFGSNLYQEVANEIGVYFEKKSKDEDDRKYMKKLPIFYNLLTNYEAIREECERTKINFRGHEKLKRESFYKQNKFRNEIALLKDKSLKKEKKKEKNKRKKENKTTEDREEKE